MKIESKFNINQKVYHIVNARERTWVPCSGCDSSGSITLKDGKARECPVCYGRKGESEYLPTKWQLDVLLTIGSIGVKVTNIKSTSGFANMGEYADGCTEIEEEYMMYETGIGSGRVYYIKDLFHTKEEAQTECNDRNV